MKRKIFLSVFVAIIVAVPAMSHASFFDFFKFDFKNLGAQAKTSISAEVRPESFARGDKDPEISYIQELLVKKGYYSGKISGLFGALTEKAILNWQTKNNLEATGTLDKATVESIAEIREDDSDRGGSTLISINALLGGSYNPLTSLMSTALNDANLIPIIEPYSAAGYDFVGGGDEETTTSVFSVTGPDAIVDWVVVELRNPFNMREVSHSRAALIQADGDIVDVDGVSPISVPMSGMAYVSVIHRNHLPIITINQQTLTDPIPLTTENLFGTNPAKIVNGKQVLWPGDINRDNFIKYAGDDNDRDLILQAIGGNVPTATISNEYRSEDVNMDGMVKYAGANNDRDIILQSIGGGVPTNVVTAQLPELYPIELSLISTSSSSFSGGGSDVGTFEIEFEVQNLSDGSVVIPNAEDLADGLLTMGQGAEYSYTTDAGQTITNLVSALICTDGNCNQLLGGGYSIEEGESSEFLLTVSFQPQTDGFFRVFLYTFNWDHEGVAPANANQFYTIDLGQHQLFSTFSTDYLFLNAI